MSRNLLTCRIAANIAKLPELLTRPQHERHALMADWERFCRSHQ